MGATLAQHDVIQKSIRRLQNMGFKTYIGHSDQNSLLLLIDRDSIVKTLTRMIDRQISYPNHMVAYDRENHVVVVAFWKGNLPAWLEAKLHELLTKGE